MLAPPPDLSTGDIARALRRHWGIEVDATDLRYVPVGFGGHHWRARDSAGTGWFVTVDVSDEAEFALRRAAFRTAGALQTRAKLPFVLAPVANHAGEPLCRLGESYALSVTPWVDGAALGEGPYVNDADVVEVLRLLGLLHDPANVALCPDAPLDDLAISSREALERALVDTVPWQGGPYAAGAFALVHEHRSAIRSALARYDGQAAVLARDRARWVVTHGEPHAGNVLRDSEGVLHLIDWDTVRLAPPERDLWSFAPDVTADQFEVSQEAASLYRMRWDLSEIAEYVSWFHAPHAGDANARYAWEDVQQYLPLRAEVFGQGPGGGA